MRNGELALASTANESQQRSLTDQQQRATADTGACGVRTRGLRSRRTRHPSQPLVVYATYCICAPRHSVATCGLCTKATATWRAAAAETFKSSLTVATRATPVAAQPSTSQASPESANCPLLEAPCCQPSKRMAGLGSSFRCGRRCAAGALDKPQTERLRSIFAVFSDGAALHTLDITAAATGTTTIARRRQHCMPS
jgi:hypothetical protein